MKKSMNKKYSFLLLLAAVAVVSFIFSFTKVFDKVAAEVPKINTVADLLNAGLSVADFIMERMK